MKLATRYNRTNLIISFLILLITGVIYYFAIHYILSGKLDNDLAIEEQEIRSYAATYQKLPEPANFKNEVIKYNAVGMATKNFRRHQDTVYYNHQEKKMEPARTLQTVLTIKNQKYLVSVTRSKVESEELIRLIFFISLSILGFTLLLIFIVNRFILNNLWQPFYTTLSQIKAFNVSEGNIIKPEPTAIDEFTELNAAALAMAARVNREYTDLKTFTNNASHEMMTPLAVMLSLLDNLLQQGEYTQEQGRLLDELYQAINRLQKMNESLLLLVKIEHNLIKEQKLIAVNEIISSKIAHFRDFFNSRNIRLTVQLEEKQVLISRYLLEILMNNLIGNAVRHNIEGGEIIITLSGDELMIKNTGREIALEKELIFDRFYKQSNSEGTGLGLAISKQIAALYGFSLLYTYATPYHQFTLNFIKPVEHSGQYDQQ